MNQNSSRRNPGSFRDPASYVLEKDNIIYRVITPQGMPAYQETRASGFVNQLIEKQWLLPENVCELKEDDINSNHELILTHPKLPSISYPYEWTFSALKQAALFHLQLQEYALHHGVVLTDASAFNIQFVNSKPIFIDHMAFRPYREGEYWLAHQQFCHEFLNPLLFQVLTKLPFQPLYRSNINGISTNELARLVPLRKKFSWNILLQVILPAYFNKKNKCTDGKKLQQRPLPKSIYLQLIQQLHKWIERLTIDINEPTQWQQYAVNNHYLLPSIELKKQFITDFIEHTTPELLLDIGCNQGDYPFLALQAGAKSVIGIDTDSGALEEAFKKAQTMQIPFQALYQDITKPSPDQGWNNAERIAFTKRIVPNALFALAIIHHLAFFHNIPLEYIVEYLVNLAPKGVIEFIPKQDPMVQQMLSLRGDIFPEYSQENFLIFLSKRAKIIKYEVITSAGRTLYWYEK